MRLYKLDDQGKRVNPGCLNWIALREVVEMARESSNVFQIEETVDYSSAV
jgi:hypothetical protein